MTATPAASAAAPELRDQAGREAATTTRGLAGELSGLAKSRGVPLMVVLRAAAEDRLAEIIRLPVGADPVFLVTGAGRAWRRVDVAAWARLTETGC